MKASVLRYAAIGMATLSLTGFAAASTVSLGYTGPDSHNKVNLSNSNRETTTNRNNVGVANLTAQSADTGNVRAYKNTSVDGNVSSGPARNDSSVATNVAISNPSSSGGSGGSWMSGDSNVNLSYTGPESDNHVNVRNSNEVKVNNTNNVNVLNYTAQSASSGNVSAEKNTTVGGLSSGEASNTSNVTTSVNISN
jgi:hypothetical protein